MTLPHIPQIYHLGSLELHTYGITFALAAVAAYFIGRKFSSKRGISHSVFDDMAFWALVLGFICARAYFVIFHLQDFSGNYWSVLETWNGGIGIYGGVIGGLAAIIWRSRKLKIKLSSSFDVFAIALPLAQVIGRIGNYINNEAFGLPTNLPWKIYIPLSQRPALYAGYSYFHPTFLYEMIWDAIVFFIVYFFAFKKRKSGKIAVSGLAFGLYLVSYSFGRFWIESLRLDSTYIFAGIKLDQVVSTLLFIIGWVIILGLPVKAISRGLTENEPKTQP